jgi:hypothetical protein
MVKIKIFSFLNLAAFMVLFGLLFFLFRHQALSPVTLHELYGYISTPGAPYVSDLAPHIHSANDPALRGYSLFAFIFHILSLPADPAATVPVFLALTAFGTLWATWRLLKYLTPEAEPWLLWLCAWLLFFAMPFWIPGLSFQYLLTLSGALWHNPTYLGMKLLAVLALPPYFKVHETYRQKIDWPSWALFTIFLTLGTMIKPSFIIAFAPVMAFFLLIELFRRRGRGWAKAVIFGAAVLPSLAVCLYQAQVLFVGPQVHSRVAFGFLTLYGGSWFDKFLFGHLLSLIFPALVYWFLRDFRRGRFDFQVMTLSCLLAASEGLFLYETGSRMTDGNFTWGAKLGVFLLFVQAGVLLCRWTASRRLVGFTASERRLAGFLWGALVVHGAFGLVYFGRLLQGAPYWH